MMCVSPCVCVCECMCVWRPQPACNLTPTTQFEVGGL